MPLPWRHILVPSVTVRLVLPPHEPLHPWPGIVQRVEWLLRPQRSAFSRAEHCLGMRVVIAHPGSAELGHHTEVLHCSQHR
jgi:hypothetical protein